MTGLILTFIAIGSTSIHGVCGTDWYADYNKSTHEIRYCVKNQFIIQHETGHYIYNEKLTQKQRDKYAKLSNISKIKTVNGSYNTEEDFADTYAMMKTGKILSGYRARVNLISSF